MSVPSKTAFIRRFRTISARDRRLFLAALWEARGYETEIENGVIFATDDDSVRIDVVGITTRADSDADILVGTRESDWVRTSTKKQGVEFISPSELYNLFLYGIGRETATQLARDHLAEIPTRTVLSLVLILTTGFTIAIILGGAIGTVPGHGGNTALQGTSPGIDFSHLEADSTSELPSVASGNQTPRGLSTDGVSNTATLAQTHQRQTSGKPRVVHLTYEGPTNTSTHARATSREFTLRVDTDSRYRFVVDETVVIDEANTTIEIESDEFSEGSRLYRQVQITNATSWRNASRFGTNRTFSLPGYVDWQSRPERTLQFMTLLYECAMSPDETSVEHVQLVETTHYRVVATGEPDGCWKAQSDFRAVAYLTTDGRLSLLSVSYTHVESGKHVSIDISYRNVDAVEEVNRPPWYRDASTRERAAITV